MGGVVATYYCWRDKCSSELRQENVMLQGPTLICTRCGTNYSGDELKYIIFDAIREHVEHIADYLTREE
jgi:hypothetical protein